MFGLWSGSCQAVRKLVDPRVPEYCMSKVSEDHARAAYAALLKFTDVVKANPIAPTAPTTAVSSEAAGAIEAAATKLGSGSYAFIKGVDWADRGCPSGGRPRGVRLTRAAFADASWTHIGDSGTLPVPERRTHTHN